MQLKLNVDLPTSLNKLYINQHTYNPRTKTSTATGARILSAEGKLSKKMIQRQARQQLKVQEWDFEYTKTNYVYLDAVIYFNRKGRDDNNLYKLLCDALEGIVYDNDSRVLIRTQRIYYDANNPRMEITLHPVKFVGVFDDKEQMEQFEKKCQDCNRYSRNCSILKAAKEGRIQEEISNDLICTNYKHKSLKK